MVDEDDDPVSELTEVVVRSESDVPEPVYQSQAGATEPSIVTAHTVLPSPWRG